MTKNALIDVLKIVVTVFHRRKIKMALMGGLATSIYSPPRATFDIDAIADIAEGKLNRLLAALKQAGLSYDEKNPVKIINGLSFITLYFPRSKIYFDLFLAESGFQKMILERSRTIRVGELRLSIISPEDLILVKLMSGRPRDTEDARQILIENFKELDFTYLRTWAAKLGIAVFLKDEIKGLMITPHKRNPGR